MQKFRPKVPAVIVSGTLSTILAIAIQNQRRNKIRQLQQIVS